MSLSHFIGVKREMTSCVVLSCLNNQNRRPFPSCFEPHYESEAKCKAFIMKISFHSHANKGYFHMKSFALSLAFITRFLQLGNGLLK